MRSETLEKLKKNYTGLKQFEQVADRTINKWQLRSRKFKNKERKVASQTNLQKQKGLRADKKLNLEDHI